MASVTVSAATKDDISALVASVAGLFAEDAGRHDSLTDLSWPEREGTAYYSALLDDGPAWSCWLAMAATSSGTWSASCVNLAAR